MPQDTPEKVLLYGPDGQTEEVEPGSERDLELQEAGWELRHSTPPGTVQATPPGPKEPAAQIGKKSEGGMVSVSAEKLEKMFELLEEQKKDIEMLKSTADVDRVDRWKSQHQGVRPQYVRISTYRKRIVYGWVTVTNDVTYDAETKTVNTDQVMEIILEGTEEDKKAGKDTIKLRLPYSVFGVAFEKLDAEVLSTTTAANGHNVYAVKILATKVDGSPTLIPELANRELSMDAQFVN
jgi:hypothetical protein